MDLSAIAFLAIVFATLLMGIWVGLALLVSAAIVVMLYTSIPIGPLMAQYTMNILTTPDLVALPLFIIMGEFLFRTRLSERLFSGLAPWAGLMPGRLIHVNVIASTIFASISGSSAATTQVVGRMSLTELLRRGYGRGISVGSLAGAGTLGLLIPPSSIMIIYGVLAQESVLRLFAAGVFPGLLLATLFVLYIVVCALIKPDLVPESERKLSAMPMRDRLAATVHLLPVLGLVILVMGSMYAGFATPTEAAAFGVLGAALVAKLDGTLNRQSLREIAKGSVQTCSMMGLILVGATILSFATTILGYPQALNNWVATMDLSPLMLIAMMLVVYLLMGTFMDGFSMIVTTLPIFLPLAVAAGFDPIWFGIFIIVTVEMSNVTPPVGFNLFVINKLTGDSVAYITKHTMPFLLLMCAIVFILVWFPQIATWLPSALYG
ncbi:MAG: TRAP transporter large permease subunit [Devosia sp.]|nr:TRAP transporter large permease subunit [Devosia sp.]